MTTIATKSMTVDDPHASGDEYKREIVEGQPVPAELLDAYEAKTGKSRTADVDKAERAPAKDKARKAPETDK